MPDHSPEAMPGGSGLASPGNCSECRFWEHKRDHDGFCKRTAPRPGPQENDIARWRLTYATDWCGEGEVQSGVDVRIPCGACEFWTRPENGIEPLQYGERFKAWWQRAGHCRRYAPQATAELGGRSFWPATHDDDTCGDGRAKV